MGISGNAGVQVHQRLRASQNPAPDPFCISISLNDVGAVECSPSPGIDQLMTFVAGHTLAHLSLACGLLQEWGAHGRDFFPSSSPSVVTARGS